MIARPLRQFLDEQESVDGYPALSEAKEAVLDDPSRVMVVMEGEEVVALGAVKVRDTPGGTERAAFETVVPRPMRFAEFEDRVVAETVALIPNGVSYTAWSRRLSLDAALERRGMVVVRSLAEMAVPLPILTDLDERDSIPVRSFSERDIDALIQINHAAFGDHPEAGLLDRTELTELMDESWFDPDGILLHESGGEAAGFCWTKVHPNGEGEVYRIGVDPAHRGKGLGRALTLAGYDYLSREKRCTSGFLWVDEANGAAVSMYESIGLSIRSRNREFAPSG